MRDLPKDVLVDKTSLTKDQHDEVVKLLKDIRPTYMMDVIPELNKWFSVTVENYKENVQEYSVQLQQIKEINTKERYKQTLTKVDESVFTSLVEDVLFV